jgi:hypothetical protein
MGASVDKHKGQKCQRGKLTHYFFLMFIYKEQIEISSRGSCSLHDGSLGIPRCYRGAVGRLGRLDGRCRRRLLVALLTRLVGVHLLTLLVGVHSLGRLLGGVHLLRRPDGPDRLGCHQVHHLDHPRVPGFGYRGRRSHRRGWPRRRLPKLGKQSKMQENCYTK